MIKASLGKLKLPELAPRYVSDRLSRQGILSLPVTQAHAVKVYDLPPHHRDPFDRLIIAQAVTENMTVLTADREFAKYPVDVVWCGA
jgi:PIN domain nuclease of toxin-antitoxin system